MADHVSPETGLALRDAGLAWTPAVGAWVWIDGGPEVVCGIHAAWMSTVDFYERESASPGDCIWLPTTGQLLSALAKEHSPQISYNAFDDRWHVLLSLGKWVVRPAHQLLPEALAAALLAALKEEAT